MVEEMFGSTMGGAASRGFTLDESYHGRSGVASVFICFVTEV